MTPIRTPYLLPSAPGRLQCQSTIDCTIRRICPKGERLYSRRQKPIDENTKAIIYRNYEACGKCEFKDKCTKDKKGRRIRRSIFFQKEYTHHV
ncbi:transposase [Tissierella sp. MSJ-40]|uniref:Transposase n=1 Tax=Tissierella simiarum TaxID=2841534 RepID=A0ABS6EA69_9FIRM|nr:transposase [Tissierella simiarum]